MPGKSRRQKERKINKAAAVSEQLASTAKPGITVTVNGPAPTGKYSPAMKSVSASAAAATKAAASPFIKRELLTIALMTGVMLVAIVVISIVLH